MASILCYVVAGVLLNIVCIFGFVKMPGAPEAGWILMGVFGVPALVMLAIGAACARPADWKRGVDIVCVATAAYTAFSVFSMACIFWDPAYRSQIPPRTIDFFSNYVNGFASIAVLGAVGAVLMKSSKRTSS